MKIVSLLLSVLLWVSAAPALAADGGVATIVEGSPTLLRAASWYKLAEGVRLQEGDVVDAPAAAAVRVELFDGTALNLQGPASLYMVTLPAKDGKLTGAAEFYLTRGWLKLAAPNAKSGVRVRTPLMGLSTSDGVVVIHVADQGDVFIEAGNVRLGDPGRKATDATPSGKAGEYWSRAAAGRPYATAPRAPPAFLSAMPQHFMVTIPERLTRFQSRRVEPVLLREATFADAEPWLNTPYRTVFVNRFQARLKDPAFQKAAEPRLRDVPEWDKSAKPEPPVKKAEPEPPPPPKSLWERLFGQPDRAKGVESMKLMVKFNLMLLAIFLIGFAVAWYVASSVLQANAREEILQNAQLMIEAASSSRNYTNVQVKPLLDTQLKYTFLPQSVPNFAAIEQFNDLRKKYPDYAYKEATLNPTNPRDRAADWEADVVNSFRQTPSHTELMGERETPQGRSLYLARPIQITDATCLVCHSTADAAPKTMIDVYGSSNGFGWKMKEVVGAQIVSVPMSGSIKRADDTLKTFMLALGGVLLLTFILLNVMMQLVVIRRVTRLSRLANQVSLGSMEAGEFRSRSKDEIGVLTDSLSRMKASLVQAMKMLDE